MLIHKSLKRLFGTPGCTIFFHCRKYDSENIVANYIIKNNSQLPQITEYLPDYVDMFDYNSELHKLSEADIRAVLGQIISTCQHLVGSS